MFLVFRADNEWDARCEVGGVPEPYSAQSPPTPNCCASTDSHGIDKYNYVMELSPCEILKRSSLSLIVYYRQ